MKFAHLFHSYELLQDKADEAFRKMEKEHGTCIKCERHCTDCCHAVFGLFLIEAAYLKQQFDQLDSEGKKEALLRCNESDRALKRLEKTLQVHENDPQMQVYTMARERVGCPLLSDKKDCVLYSHRPITCRVYGMPTRIQGKARVCGKADFKRGETYPVFNLDGAYRNLYIFSKELLSTAGKGDPGKATLLISVSKAISTPVETLINENFQ